MYLPESIPSLRCVLAELAHLEPSGGVVLHLVAPRHRVRRSLHLPTHPGHAVPTRRLLRASLNNLLAVWGDPDLHVEAPAEVPGAIREAAEQELQGVLAGALGQLARRIPASGAGARGPAPPTHGWVVAADVGGTDVKLVVARDGQVLAQLEHSWRVRPADFEEGAAWERALVTLIGWARACGGDPSLPRGDLELTEIDAIVDSCRVKGQVCPIDSVLLAFPDVVVGEQIVGGMTGKTLGLARRHGGYTPGYWEEFAATIQRLPLRLGEIFSAHVEVITDGEAAALAVAGGYGLRWALSLGTSIAAGIVRDGSPERLPLYVGALLIEADPGSASRHDTTHEVGAAQKGPTQKGLLERLKGEVPFGVPPKVGLDLLNLMAAEPGRAALRAVYARAGRLLAATALELAFCLGEHPERVHLMGRVVRSQRPDDGAAQLVEAARAALGAAGWQAALVVADGAAGGIDPHFGQARALLRLSGAGDAPRGPGSGGEPGIHYDVIVVTASDFEEARAQQVQLQRWADLRPGAAPRVVSVLERWPGGAGNLLGTLLAWREACAQARASGWALEEEVERGALRVVMIHNGGAGKRCSPLVQAAGGARGAIRLPGERPGAQAPWRLIEWVVQEVQPFAASNDGRRLDVFWSSQVFYGAASPSRVPAGPGWITKLCAPLPGGQAPTARERADLGLFALDAAGRVVAFAPQGSLGSDAQAAEFCSRASEVAFDLGAFRLRWEMLALLLEVYGPQLATRTGKRDLDPDLVGPLLSLRERIGADGIPEGWAEERGPGGAEVLEVARRLAERAPPREWVGCASVFAPVTWWRYRRTSELLGEVHRLLESAMPLEGGALAAPGAEGLLGARGIQHPVERCLLGGVWVEGPELSWAQVAAGVEVGGVTLRRSMLRHCSLLPGSRVVQSVVEDSAGWLEADGSWVVGSVVGQLRSQGGLVYTVAEGGPLDVRSECCVDVWRGELPKGVARIRATLDVDGKAQDEEILGGNVASFSQLRAMTESVESRRARQLALGEARAALGMAPVDGATSPWALEAWAREGLGLSPAEPERWTDVLERLERGRGVPPPLAGLIASWAAASLPPSPPAVAALAWLAGSADEAVAARVTRPLFARVVEGLNDRLDLASRRASAQVLYGMWDGFRRRPAGAAFDGVLARAGVADQGELITRHQRVTSAPPQLPPSPREVVVLPRVTLGAEIAITSVALGALARAWPHAQLSLIGDPRLEPLFGGLPQLRLLPLSFGRRGGLAGRLASWIEVFERVSALKPDLVVGLNSRVDQLATLPVPGPYLYWEDALSPAEVPQPHSARVGRFMAGVLGQVGEPPRPTLWFSEGLAAQVGPAVAAMRSQGRPVVAVKYDVGGAPSKSLGLDFERGHLGALLREREDVVVLLDRGFSSEELAHSHRLLEGVRAQGVEVVAVTDQEGGQGERLDRLVPPGPGPCVVAFHGSLGGFVGLAQAADEAFSYDSVFQHAAAADKVIMGHRHPGTPLVVAFVGYPVPAFPAVWAPVGASPVEKVELPEWPASGVLERVMLAHRRLRAAASERGEGQERARALISARR